MKVFCVFCSNLGSLQPQKSIFKGKITIPCISITQQWGPHFALVTIFLNLSDHLPKHVRNFAAEGGHSLLRPEATTFLGHMGVYSRPEAATDACGQRSQGFMSPKSRLKPEHLVTLSLTQVKNFAAEGGYTSFWLKSTIFLSNKGLSDHLHKHVQNFRCG